MILRCLFVLFAVVYDAGSAFGAASSYAVYVSNETSGDVTVLDGESLKVLKTFPVGKRPRGIEVSPDGKHVLVAVSGSPRMGPGADPERARSVKADKTADGIAILDAESGTFVRRLAVGSDPEEFAFSNDGRRVFVANEDTGEASAWDVESGINLWTSRVSDEPEGVATHPTRPEVFVSCEDGGDIYILDTSRGTQLARIPVGARPRSVTFSADGLHAYAALEGASALAVIDVRDRRLSMTIKLGQGALPMGVAVAPDQGSVFVTTGRAGMLARVDLATSKVTNLAVGKRPWGIVLNPDRTKLFTANGPSNDVSVIDVASMKEIRRIKVGEGPWGVAIGPKP